LTQVLDDGRNTYTYGLGRISQSSIVNQQSEIAYFLGDALGSVRQLTNSAGEVTFTKAYDPYGNVTQTSGEGQSAFGYTGEQQSNDMMYLRARYYNSANGRFLNRDTFAGYLNLSQSQNRYAYAHNNPILYTDPTGHSIPAPFFIALLRSGVQNIISYIADCDNQNYVIGALGQYVDDVTFGLYSNYFLDLDAFNQDGRNLGHSIALTQAMIETTIGTLAIAAALPTITITLVGGTACAAVTGGLCAIPVAPILVGEVGLLALGTALTAHGGLMIARAAAEGGGGGRGFAVGEQIHINRINAVNVDKFISKHPWALTESANGRHVVETEQLISRLENSVASLEKIKPHLNPSEASEAANAIADGNAKIRQLESWLSQNPNR